MKVTIFDLFGEAIRILDRGNRSAGSLSIVWDGLDEEGRIVGNGPYFYQLSTGGVTKVKKILLVK